MKHINLLSTVAALAFAAGMASAEVKIAQDCPPDPETCGTYVWAHTFSENLAANGFETVEFARGALGDEAELLDQVSSGLLEVSMSDVRSAGSFGSFIYGMNLPFLFGSHAELDAAVAKGDLLTKINAQTTPNGVRVLALVANGSPAGIFNTKKAIETIDDLADLRMRALDESQIRMYEAWGSTGTIVSWPEVPSALQTGVADGYLNAPVVPLMFGHDGFLRHFTDVKFSAPVRVALASEDWYQGLSDDERAVVTAAIEEATAANRTWVQGQDKVLAQLEAVGIAVVQLSDEERGKFAEASRSLYEGGLVSPEDVAVWVDAAGAM